MPSILIIEDSPTQALRMRMGLQQKGFTVAVVNDPQEAAAAARTQTPDAVVSDVNMPGLNGYQLCEVFRDDASLQSIPVILTSASVDPADYAKATASGAKALVEKGNDVSGLVEILNGLAS